MHEDCHIDFRKVCTLDIGKAWQWAAASGTPGRFRGILKGSPRHGGVGADTWHQTWYTLVLAYEKKLCQCSGRFIEIMPPLAARYHTQIAFRSTTRYLEAAVQILARLRQRSLMGNFYLLARSLSISKAAIIRKDKGTTGVEYDALHGTRTLRAQGRPKGEMDRLRGFSHWKGSTASR